MVVSALIDMLLQLSPDGDVRAPPPASSHSHQLAGEYFAASMRSSLWLLQSSPSLVESAQLLRGGQSTQFC